MTTQLQFIIIIIIIIIMYHRKHIMNTVQFGNSASQGPADTLTIT